jgi:hypothetical protein
MNVLHARAIWKVTSSELLKNQPMRKQISLYACTENRYILGHLWNISTTGMKALMLGNKFLFTCVKEACRLSHVLIPFINSLLLKHYDLNPFFK